MTDQEKQLRDLIQGIIDENATSNMFSVSPIAFHTHNGVDSPLLTHLTLVSGGYVNSGKTTFTDSVHNGFWLGSDGLYVGSASDANFMKFTNSTGSFSVKGAITTTTGSVINGTYIDQLAVGKLVTGTMDSQAITLASATGDAYIAGGNALDLTNWRGGDGSGGAVILGLDYSDSSKGKLFVGNYSTSKYIKFDGTDVITNNIAIVDTYTEGETLAVGNVVCIKNGVTNNLVTITDNAYVNGTVGFRDTNYNGANNDPLYIGTVDSGVRRIFIKVPTNDAQSLYKIQKVVLYLFQGSTNPGTVTNITLKNCNAAWDTSTITYNNAPAVTDDFSTYYTVSNFGNPPGALTWMALDITHMYKAWKNGDKTNNGIEITGTSAAGTNYITFQSTSGAHPPYVGITYNGGSDGKAYKADADYWDLSRSVIGVVKSRDTGAGTCLVQKTGQAYIPSSGAQGNPLYLSTTGGIVSGGSGNRNIIIGYITRDQNYSDLAIQKRDIYIESLLLPTSGKAIVFGATVFHPISDCSMIRIWCTADDSVGTIFRGYINVKKGASVTNKLIFDSTHSITVNWTDASTVGFSRQAGVENMTIYSVEFYN